MFIKQIILTLIPLVILDGIWLFSTGKIFYKKFLSHLMSTSPSWLPVVLFYIIYAIGITVFVTMPAIQNGMLYLKIFLAGGLFGFVAYGAYDFTNQATLREWPIIVTIVDLAWGAVLTGIVSVISVYLGSIF